MVFIKTRSTPASLSFKGQATKQETAKWSILKFNGPIPNAYLFEFRLSTYMVLFKVQNSLENDEIGIVYHSVIPLYNKPISIKLVGVRTVACKTIYSM